MLRSLSYLKAFRKTNVQIPFLINVANLHDVSVIQHHKQAYEWIQEYKNLLKPDSVKVCDGSDAEFDQLCEQLVKSGAMVKLNEKLRPNSYLARSTPSDVARVEGSTYICSQRKEDAGPTNNWIDPNEMKEKLDKLFDGAMKGRTMYVIPYSMGPLSSPFSKIGLEITDSPYVVVNMKIMTRMGDAVLKSLKNNDFFVKGVHSVGAPLKDGEKDVSWPCNDQKYIVHYPETQSIFSFGSGYGGNALLGKKCFALRIASVLGKNENWLAEHMLIVGITNPQGVKKYICAAFPSACGKTNLAMLQSTLPGWKVETVGDDIAWLRIGEDGRLYACNPENGFFGVAPGTSLKTNKNATLSTSKNTLFTNVGLTDDKDVWWEEMTDDKPKHLIDWKNRDWTPESKEKAAHPNSRFTVPITQCPSLDPEFENPKGVPISAILFGGRRKRNIPLVFESFNWAHGVFIGASVSSEQTAAAEGKVGALRHDPFAMLPFCGYNMGDYFNHWLSFSSHSSKLPKIYSVNWFRTDKNGQFLWPGFGENMRVLKWIFERDEGKVDAIKTPVGLVPKESDLSFPEGYENNYKSLFEINSTAWLEEMAELREYFKIFGNKLPASFTSQLNSIESELKK